MQFDNISLLSLQIMYFIDILLVKVVKLTWNKKLCDRRKYSTVVGKKKANLEGKNALTTRKEKHQRCIKEELLLSQQYSQMFCPNRASYLLTQVSVSLQKKAAASFKKTRRKRKEKGSES